MSIGRGNNGDKAKWADARVMEQVWDRSANRFNPNKPDLTNIKSVRKFRLTPDQINKFTEEKVWDRATRWAELVTSAAIGERFNATQQERKGFRYV
jgi:hypothetical protein